VLAEFKDFINRGNFVDLAVAFVLGLAFNTVVTTLVDRVVMPVIGVLVGQPNFDTVGQFGCDDTGVCAGSVGAVLTALINFLLIALVMFLIVKAYNRMRTPAGATEPAPPEDVVLLREIRDALRGNVATDGRTPGVGIGGASGESGDPA
jgi:large conductance mechanosensitive channel